MAHAILSNHKQAVRKFKAPEKSIYMVGDKGMAAATDWFFWALLSAVFAALTAIFAKIGLEGID
jgi:hypothetical protein